MTSKSMTAAMQVVMTPEKRDTVVRVAEESGYSDSDEGEMSLLANMYDVAVDDANQAAADARSSKTAAVQTEADADTTRQVIDDAAVLAAAAAEFNLAHPMEGQAEECG